MPYVIEYIWTHEEAQQEINELKSDPRWVAEHAPETAEEFVEQYPRDWVNTENGLSGLDYVSPGDSVRRFPTKKSAQAHVRKLKRDMVVGEEIPTPTYPGEFIVWESS